MLRDRKRFKFIRKGSALSTQCIVVVSVSLGEGLHHYDITALLWQRILTCALPVPVLCIVRLTERFVLYCKYDKSILLKSDDPVCLFDR